MALPSSLLKLSILMNVRVLDQNVAFVLLEEPLQDSIFNPPPMASNKRGIHSRGTRGSKNILNGCQNRATFVGVVNAWQKPFFPFCMSPFEQSFSALCLISRKKN